jgi:cell division protein FtsL
VIRLLNICVIAGLVFAAVHVYRIKFESTRQAERLANLRAEIRREHDTIAALRAEFTRLDNPIRIQNLAARHLALKPIDASQIDRLDRLPERPNEGEGSDPIGMMVQMPRGKELHTSSIASAGDKR